MKERSPIKITSDRFLEGQPRVHYEDLDSVDNEYDGESVWHREGTPFSGIAWEELRGHLTEDSMRNGVQHGRCVRFHANGQMAFDGNYRNGMGDGDHYEWYDSGVLKSLARHDPPSWSAAHRLEYNETGSLVKEVDERDGSWRLRHWYANGALLYDGTHEVTTIHAPDGSLAIRETGDRVMEFRDEVLFQHAAGMLEMQLGLVENPVWAWLHARLDEGKSKAKQLLFDLTDHPIIDVAETAIFIIGHRRYREATELIQRLTHSTRRKPPDAGGFMGTTAELAETVLVELTAPEEELEDRLAELEQLQEEREDQRWAEEQEALLREQRTWPETTAHHRRALIGETTIRTGDQILTDQFVSRSCNHVHVYQYKVNGATYRAVVTTDDPSAAESITIRYCPTNPEEYVVN
ncbi:MAG: hypothetical protein RIC55_00845 [Pirellulaceae bacterium]